MHIVKLTKTGKGAIAKAGKKLVRNKLSGNSINEELLGSPSTVKLVNTISKMGNLSIKEPRRRKYISLNL